MSTYAKAHQDVCTSQCIVCISIFLKYQSIKKREKGTTTQASLIKGEIFPEAPEAFPKCLLGQNWVTCTPQDPSPAKGGGSTMTGQDQSWPRPWCWNKVGFSYRRRWVRAVAWAANSVCRKPQEMRVNLGRRHKSGTSFCSLDTPMPTCGMKHLLGLPALQDGSKWRRVGRNREGKGPKIIARNPLYQ